MDKLKRLQEIKETNPIKNSGQFKVGHKPYIRIYKMTDEQREQIRKRMTGKAMSEETKKKIRLSKIGNIPWNKGLHVHLNPAYEFKKGQVSPWKGRKASLETRKKQSEAHKGMIPSWKGKKLPNRSGANCHLWKGGITPINRQIRTSLEYKLFRDAVFARDWYTCQKTKISGGDIVVHHILNFAEYPELRFAIDNGVTLSKKAHILFHKKYGNKNNNREQLEEFIGRKI